MKLASARWRPRSGEGGTAASRDGGDEQQSFARAEDAPADPLDSLTNSCGELRRRVAELERENAELKRRSKRGSVGSAAGSRPPGRSSLGLRGSVDPSFANATGSFHIPGSHPPPSSGGAPGRPGGRRRRSRGSEHTAADLTAATAYNRHARAAEQYLTDDNSDDELSITGGGGGVEAAGSGGDGGSGRFSHVREGGRRRQSTPHAVGYSLGRCRWSVGTTGGRGAAEADKRFMTTAGSGDDLAAAMLVSTMPITSNEQAMAFMEFGVVGIDPEVLMGRVPPQPFGQPVAVLERFPEAAEAGCRGFVEGLADFCFPAGAEIRLVPEHKAEALHGFHEDRMHVLQFTDGSRTTSYGCCVIVTERLSRPCAPLLVALWRRELENSAARTLQKFFLARLRLHSAGDARSNLGNGAGNGGNSWWGRGNGSSSGNGDGNNGRGLGLAAMMEAFLRTPSAAAADPAGGDTGRVAPGLKQLAAAVAAAAAAAEAGSGTAAAGGVGAGASKAGGGLLNMLSPFRGARRGMPGSPLDAVASPVSGAAAPTSAAASIGVRGLAAAVCNCDKLGCTGCGAVTPPLTLSPPPSRRRVVGGGEVDENESILAAVGIMSPPPRSRRGNSATPLRPGLKKGHFLPEPDDEEEEKDRSSKPKLRSASHKSSAVATAGTFSDDESDDGADSAGGSITPRGGVCAGPVTPRNNGGSGTTPSYGSPPPLGGVGPRTPTRTPAGLSSPMRSPMKRTPTRDGTVATGCGGGSEESGAGWAVLVQRCFVMVSCHPLHPALFKVLRAVADGERNKSAAAPPPPPREGDPSTALTPPRNRRPASAASTVPSSDTAITPPRQRALAGGGERTPPRGQGSQDPQQTPPRRDGTMGAPLSPLPVAGSPLATEAARTAQRHLRRARMLQHLRESAQLLGANTACTAADAGAGSSAAAADPAPAGTADAVLSPARVGQGQGSGATELLLHYPPYDKIRLTGGGGTPLELWSSAVALSLLPAESVVRAVNVLLLEKSLVVVGKDLGLVSVTATALLSLLRPFDWEGVFIPVLPAKLLDVLQSPVPVVVGLQGPYDVDDPRLHGVVVLDVDAPAAEDQFHMASVQERLPVCAELCAALQAANTLQRQRVAGDGSIAAAARPSSRRYGAGVHALSYMSGLTQDERKSVTKMRQMMREHVMALCGDLMRPGAWRRYGAFNTATGDFEFYPGWFMEPMERQLAFQKAVAHSQMMISYVDGCRQKETAATATSGVPPDAAEESPKGESIPTVGQSTTPHSDSPTSFPPPPPRENYCVSPPPLPARGNRSATLREDGSAAPASRTPPPLPQRKPS